MLLEKLSKYKNLFLDQESKELYQLLGGEMQPIKDGVIVLKEQDQELDPFAERLRLMDEKVRKGEISCNLDNPEDCINCGS